MEMCFFFFSKRLFGVSNILSCWMFGWVKRKSSLRPLVVCDFAHLLCTVQFEKEDAPLLTNYLYAWTFAFCLYQYKRKKEQNRCLNDFGDMQEFCVVRFSVTISITISMSFFVVNVILVIHVPYYITVYLNDVKSCMWFGYMCARRRCESQYRKMLYFCYEIY